MGPTRARLARGCIRHCRVSVARALLALIGTIVPNLARVLAWRAGIAPFRDAFRRRIEPGRAVLARRDVVCSNSTAKLAFWAEHARCLVQICVRASLAICAITTHAADLAMTASEAYARS